MKRAEDLLNDDSAADSQLREAESELLAAYDALEYSTANRENLWAAIEVLHSYIESGEYKNFTNADELKDIYDNALPVAYYEPEQSVIDEWTAKIYAALEEAGVITPTTSDTTEPTDTTASYPTIPSSESPTGTYTEPFTTEDPTGHCTEFDLPYSLEFSEALSAYTTQLLGSSISIGEIDLFYYDKEMVVFGLSDMLCTVGEEDIDGYHFENWNFFPHEANKTGYCVYFNGTVYSIAEAVQKNIMSARALASIIPHSSKIDPDHTNPTGVTEPYTEFTNPTETTEPETIEIICTYPIGEDNRARSELIELIAEYQWIYEECLDPAASIYEVSSAQNFRTAYENAQTVINDYEASETQIVNAYTTLKQSYGSLALKLTQGTEVSDARKALEYAVVSCVPKGNYVYNPESLSEYNAAYKEACDLLNDSNASDEQLWAAREKLFNAYNKLYATATYATESTYMTMPATTENPTGHCILDDDLFKMQFATELSAYSFELGYDKPISIDQITPYTADYKMYVFALKDNWGSYSEERIGDYQFINHNFCGNTKNRTGYCVFNGNKIYSIADAVKENIVTVDFLAGVLSEYAYQPDPTTPEYISPEWQNLPEPQDENYSKLKAFALLH
ncbi:MAG: FIVAR domain-containing protein, partial [Ruminococcus sp.]|nr:FIVAR domain-containing protein [Ruminococcus sp.]